MKSVNIYKSEILHLLRGFWKSGNVEIWRGLYTFILHYTERERLQEASKAMIPDNTGKGKI